MVWINLATQECVLRLYYFNLKSVNGCQEYYSIYVIPAVLCIIIIQYFTRKEHFLTFYTCKKDWYTVVVMMINGNVLCRLPNTFNYLKVPLLLVLLLIRHCVQCHNHVTTAHLDNIGLVPFQHLNGLRGLWINNEDAGVTSLSYETLPTPGVHKEDSSYICVTYLLKKLNTKVVWDIFHDRNVNSHMCIKQ